MKQIKLKSQIENNDVEYLEVNILLPVNQVKIAKLAQTIDLSKMSISEIANETGMSMTTATWNLDHLVCLGILDKISGRYILHHNDKPKNILMGTPLSD